MFRIQIAAAMCFWPRRDHAGDSSDRRLSLSDSQKPVEKPAEPPKPQPTRPNPARDPEFRNDPRVQPTRQIFPARNLGSDPVAAALINTAPISCLHSCRGAYLWF